MTLLDDEDHAYSSLHKQRNIMQSSQCDNRNNIIFNILDGLHRNIIFKPSFDSWIYSVQHVHVLRSICSLRSFGASYVYFHGVGLYNNKIPKRCMIIFFVNLFHFWRKNRMYPYLVVIVFVRERENPVLKRGNKNGKFLYFFHYFLLFIRGINFDDAGFNNVVQE